MQNNTKYSGQTNMPNKRERQIKNIPNIQNMKITEKGERINEFLNSDLYATKLMNQVPRSLSNKNLTSIKPSFLKPINIGLLNNPQTSTQEYIFSPNLKKSESAKSILLADYFKLSSAIRREQEEIREKSGENSISNIRTITNAGIVQNVENVGFLKNKTIQIGNSESTSSQKKKCKLVVHRNNPAPRVLLRSRLTNRYNDFTLMFGNNKFQAIKNRSQIFRKSNLPYVGEKFRIIPIKCEASQPADEEFDIQRKTDQVDNTRKVPLSFFKECKKINQTVMRMSTNEGNNVMKIRNSGIMSPTGQVQLMSRGNSKVIRGHGRPLHSKYSEMIEGLKMQNIKYNTCRNTHTCSQSSSPYI